jgi:5-methylcytosine-specific restriction endonuclease McrA
MSAKDGVVIHVDHIKPIKLHWHLKLEIDNLQVLCELCNHGKGSKYTDDWRPGEPANSDN